jgi:hypothetical protein
LLGYLGELGDAANHEIVIVDFCQDGGMKRAVAVFNVGRAKPLHLITDFPIELNPDRFHPPAASNRRTVQLIAPVIRAIAGDANGNAAP